VPSHVLARIATTGIYLLQGIPRDVQQAARVRAVREGTTLRAVLLRVLQEYAAGAWPPQRKEESRQNDLFTNESLNGHLPRDRDVVQPSN
jgi:hypothetical protein